MENFNRLRKWLNLTHDNLAILEKGSRGIVSKKSIKKGEIIMEIPEKYLIEYSRISKKFNISEDSLHNKNSLMAAYLLLENINKNNPWEIYFDTLPKNLDEYIYYFSPSKLKLLKDSSIMCKETHNFQTQMKNIKEDSKVIYHYLIKNNLLSTKKLKYVDFFKLFLRFRLYICSRIFGYLKNYNDELGLVPYADLLNHSTKPNTTWFFDDDKKAFIVSATKNIPKNCEIYDSYGDKSNVELMMYYGFTIKNNPHSKLYIGIRGKLITFTEDNIDEVIMNSDRKKIIEILLEKREKHQENLEKNDDENIKNLLLDEIRIIKKIL